MTFSELPGWVICFLKCPAGFILLGQNRTQMTSLLWCFGKPGPDFLLLSQIWCFHGFVDQGTNTSGFLLLRQLWKHQLSATSISVAPGIKMRNASGSQSTLFSDLISRSNYAKQVSGWKVTKKYHGGCFCAAWTFSLMLEGFVFFALPFASR